MSPLWVNWFWGWFIEFWVSQLIWGRWILGCSSGQLVFRSISWFQVGQSGFVSISQVLCQSVGFWVDFCVSQWFFGSIGFGLIFRSMDWGLGCFLDQ